VAEQRTSMQVADEAHARIERLNVWMAGLHRRMWAIEDKLGIPHSPGTQLTDDAFTQLEEP
jgi:hypothetical protein